MQIVTALLVISMILNLVFMLGIPATLIIRAVMRKSKWWLIGIGPDGVDIRQDKPIRGRYHWRDGDRYADVYLDGRLTKSGTDGRTVAFIDTTMMQQVAPGRPGRKQETLQKLQQIIPFDGSCELDDDDNVVIKRGDVTVGVITHTWQRLSGWRLNQIRNRINIEKMNTADGGMWGTLAKVAPIMSIIAVVGIIGIFMVVV